ncbi:MULTISPECIES: hypothetical protein [Psychrobacter]|uniref:hypothetical protein n=1 Tax=Psychrobacter TaxID=497 RepID=UPI000B41288E|nr:MULTISPECIES: hypothetical protein [Psychrobacter]HCR88267.1 hypothetical protein [Psychrobacter sp.]
MDVKGFKERRKKLEADIASATQDLISEFQDETGAKIIIVSVDLYDAGALGEPGRSIVTGASVTIGI